MSRQDILSPVVVAVGVLTCLLVLGCGKERSTVEDRPEARYELLTILGYDAARPGDESGRFRPARSPEEIARMSGVEREKLRKMMSLPYLQGSTKAPDVSNVTKYDPDRAYDGLNVYTSGHAPTAYVMDMLGNVLHEWHYEAADAWPDVPNTVHSRFFRRAYAYPNGDLLAVFEGIGLVKLDKDSRLQWSYHGGCHHQVFVTHDNRIYTLTRKAQMVPRINARSPVLPDAVTVLNEDGEKLAEYSVLDAIESSRYRHILEDMPDRPDLLHTNSIEVFERDMRSVSPQFKRGNILLSVLRIDALIVIDPDVGRVVWAQKGPWEQQHDAHLLANGHMILFNNLKAEDRSEALEFDPRTRETVWSYSGADGDTLFSRTCGTVQRLPNGNTLITESDNGRALEVTPGKEMVWEFYNPERTGDDNELIATLFDVLRVDQGYFTAPGLLEKRD